MYIPPSEFNPYTWALNSTISNSLSGVTTASILTSSSSASDSRYNYVASTSSNKFHKSTCQ